MSLQESFAHPNSGVEWPYSRGGQWGRGSPGSPSRDGDGDRKFDNPGTGTGMGTDSGGRGQERGLKIEKRGLGTGTQN